MAKQPTFKLYRICNRRNGRAFNGTYYFQQTQTNRDKYEWSATGAFYRTREKIADHIKKLTHEWHRLPYNPEKPWANRDYMGAEIPGRILDLYVECYSVLQLDMHSKTAEEFLNEPVCLAA